MNKEKPMIIELSNISFSYKKKMIYDNLSLNIEKGAIFGVLGSNGCGKSTLLKLMLHLLPLKSGKIKLFGIENIGVEQYKRVGSLIETPALYDFMTPIEHLEMLDILYKCGKNRIDYVLDKVNLCKEQNTKASKLSTGQRQRLAIAMALFNDPELLILDEPTNGLDPVGVIEMRDLLLELNEQGKTIVISSHIISELEKLCSHIAILGNGELLHCSEMDSIDGCSLESLYIDVVTNNS